MCEPHICHSRFDDLLILYIETRWSHTGPVHNACATIILFFVLCTFLKGDF